jgi:CO/xanthine dehydrogenase FAD-binding subunit
MMNFEYFAPRTLEKALTLLTKYAGDARIMAGGTDLIVQMKEGRVKPAVLIDAKHIRELNRLECDENNTLHIGAAATLDKIVAFPPIEQRFAMLRQACSLIGSVQVRNKGSLGGNVCNAAPSADSVPALLCLEARALVAGDGTRRTVPLDKFFFGPGRTVLESNELLVEIEIPSQVGLSSGCYQRHTPREEMDIAVVGVASLLSWSPENDACREARIALGAVAPTPLIAKHAQTLLVNRPLSEEIIEAAAEMASTEAVPISDQRGSAEYRRELVKVLTRRTLRKAWHTSGIRL